MQTATITISVLFGCIIGSFLNVCILRIPAKESIVSTRSHCMKCGTQIKSYDLIPIISWIVLKGKCRSCKTKISKQYPIVEAINGLSYGICAIKYGFSLETMLYSAAISALIVLSVIDYRTYEIPIGINIFIFVLGIIRAVTDYENIIVYLIGAVSISGLLLLIYLITRGQGMGGGDIKLMLAAGLLLGWKLIIVAFIFGCLYASVIHITRMIISKKNHVLAFGPYLSMGIATAIWAGEYIIKLYTENWGA